MRKRGEAARVTVIEDDTIRVDVALDEDGDLEFRTMHRAGNKWEMLEAAPTVLSPGQILGAMFKLGVVGFDPDHIDTWREWFGGFRSRAIAAGMPPEDIDRVEQFGKLLVQMFQEPVKDVVEAKRHGGQLARHEHTPSDRTP